RLSLPSQQISYLHEIPQRLNLNLDQDSSRRKNVLMYLRKMVWDLLHRTAQSSLLVRRYRTASMRHLVSQASALHTRMSSTNSSQRYLVSLRVAYFQR